MRIVVVLCFFGLASTAWGEYDYQPTVARTADLPSSTDYLNVGSLELNTFSPNSGVDSYGLEAHTDEGGLNKEYYHYSAPEEEFQTSDGSHPATATIRRNLRVVFIKAPENNGPAKAALQLAKQIRSDKTAIYVLSKQSDASDITKAYKELRSSISHKPEVRFVKYRTPEDAVNAQLGIQRQYDALLGTSRSINEGVAPVLDFSSPPEPEVSSTVDGSDFAEDSQASHTSISGDSDARAYIPPVVK